MLGANLDQPKLLTLADPNGDARAVVDGASQAEAHLKELQQPQHVQADKAAVAEQPKFYTGPLDVDEATKALAAKINQTYWDSPGVFGCMPLSTQACCSLACCWLAQAALAGQAM